MSAKASKPELRAQAGKWRDRRIGAKWQHRFFYNMIRLGGRRGAYFWVYIVVFWYVLFYASVRRNCGHYLSRRFPERSGRFQRFADCYRLVCTFAKVLVDRAAIGILGKDAYQVTFPDREAFLELLGEDKGMILVNSHVGCWQVAVAALDFIDRPISMLMKKPHELDQHYFEHSGEEAPFAVIDPEQGMGAVMDMMGVLKRREVLAVMGDRVFGNDTNTVDVDFLGEKVRFPFSAYKLAAAMGAPIAVFMSHKSGPNSYELRLARVIRVPEGTGRKDVEFGTWVSEFAGTLEKYCQDHPWQFFDFYDLWDLSDPPDVALSTKTENVQQES